MIGPHDCAKFLHLISRSSMLNIKNLGAITVSYIQAK